MRNLSEVSFYTEKSVEFENVWLHLLPKLKSVQRMWREIVSAFCCQVSANTVRTACHKFSEVMVFKAHFESKKKNLKESCSKLLFFMISAD